MWRWLLPVFCTLATIIVFTATFDTLGFGGSPWYGFWDATTLSSGKPFVAIITAIDEGGAAWKAGLRNGDTVDIRSAAEYARLAVVWQPATFKPVDFDARRSGRTLRVHLVASSAYQGNVSYKILGISVALFGSFVGLACAWLIVLQRSQTVESRLLTLLLLAMASGVFNPDFTALGNPVIGVLQSLVSLCFLLAVALLPLELASRFGRPSTFRRIITAVAVVAAAIQFAVGIAICVGVSNASIDPLPLTFGLSQLLLVAVFALVLIPVGYAVATTSRAERARAAWLLLPLPGAFLLATVFFHSITFATSYAALSVLTIFSNASPALGFLAVTYAILNRRVLDIQFVISRALVFGLISTIVIAAFVLLEWVLGTVLADVSHATGIVANAALALALGLSMRLIHRRADAFVDRTFFRKRHEDETALREFAKEAAFVTQRDALLDHGIDKLREHTDAVAAALLLDGDGTYEAIRWFGEREPASASENDEVVLALKTRHKPLDPHRFKSAIRGDLALPMLARGRLVGIVLCGERARGEAYAPDEVDALAEFAHGIGNAIDSIGRADGSETNGTTMIAEMRAMRTAIDKISERLR